MLPDDSLANRWNDVAAVNLLPVAALDLLHHHQLLFLIAVRHGECGAAMPPQSGMAVLHCLFNVLRIMVDPADNDQVLDPAGNEQFAAAIEKAKIASAQPVFRTAALDPRPEHLIGRGRIAPIALRDVWSGDPDLADLSRRQGRPAFRLDDRHALAAKLAAATYQYVAGLGACRSSGPPALQAIPADASRHRAGAARAGRDHQSGF